MAKWKVFSYPVETPHGDAPDDAYNAVVDEIEADSKDEAMAKVNALLSDDWAAGDAVLQSEERD